MTTGTASQIQRALDKAKAMGGSQLVVKQVGLNAYRVKGSAGTLYTATITRHGVECDCPAGANGRVCYHAAAVYTYLASLAAAGQAPLDAAIAPAEPVRPARPTCPVCGGPVDPNLGCVDDTFGGSHARMALDRRLPLAA